MVALSLLLVAASASIECDLSQVLGTGGTPGIENRIGFSFAALCVSEDDSEIIAGSRTRLMAVAQVMHEYPLLSILIEGHVGVSAPSEIAQEYSEARAHIVARILEEEGICPSRFTTRGWGYRVARVALDSDDPAASVAKAGFGWADMFFTLPDASEFPPRPAYYDAFLAASPPPPSSRATPHSHPIFYMAPGAQVGETLALHFFEPRARHHPRSSNQRPRVPSGHNFENKSPSPISPRRVYYPRPCRRRLQAPHPARVVVRQDLRLLPRRALRERCPWLVQPSSFGRSPNRRLCQRSRRLGKLRQ